MDGKSLNIPNQKIDELKALFPDVFTEGKIDFDRLKAALGEDVFVHGEHYELSWAGKTEARKEVQKQTTATLIPDREGSIDFDNAQNVFIEGENLEVLRALQKSYFGKVKMIYIDPPYNTGNDSFVYPDDYTERREGYNKRTGITDDEGYLNKQDLWKKNSRENGQFHSVWLSMMYPRLYLARNLMREDGVIFVSIDDNEQANLKLLMDDVFGEENFIVSISRLMKSGGAKGNFFTPNIDYILVYAKDITATEFFRSSINKEQIERYYNKTETEGIRKGQIYGEERLYKASLDIRPNQRYWIKCPDGSHVIPPGTTFPEIIAQGEKVMPVSGDGVWKWTVDRYNDEYKKGNIVFKQTTTSALLNDRGEKAVWNVYNKLWLDEQQEKGLVPSNFIEKFENRQSSAELKELNIPFDFAKPSNLIKYLVEIARVDNDDIVLDFFAGSGTTAQAVLDINEQDKTNRKFILIQMPECIEENSEARKNGYNTIADICKSRIKKVIERKQKENRGKLDFQSAEGQALGFKAYKIASSNFKVWRTDVAGKDAIIEQLEVFTQSEKQDSQRENMLHELILKAGLPLTSSISVIKVGSRNLYSVNENKLLIFFDKITPSITDKVISKKPGKVVCLNSCFDKDEDLTNFKLQLKDAGIELSII
jgi:adenine-specific DNA-methyltransferase